MPQFLVAIHHPEGYDGTRRGTSGGYPVAERIVGTFPLLVRIAASSAIKPSQRSTGLLR